MRLYMIRHGETDWNKCAKLQGRADMPLNDFGRRLAEETREGVKDIPFDVAFTSPLLRAKETAQIIIGDRDVPLLEEPRITEISFGEYEGLICAGEGYNIPDRKFDYLFDRPDKYEPPKGGESLKSVQERAGAFLNELIADPIYQDSTILISTHGCTLCGMLNLIKKEPLGKYWRTSGVPGNCEFEVVDVINGEMHMVEEGLTFYKAEAKNMYQR